MKKKMLMISGIAGIVVLALCIRFLAGSGEVPAVDKAVLAAGIVSAEGTSPEALLSKKEWERQEPSEQEMAGQGSSEWEQAEQEPTEGEQAEPDKAAVSYEDFLNGDITVEWKEQQVPIDELFRNNDIEYCFLDIDGDGSVELHIRDDFFYYVVKAQGETVQILLEDRLGGEPVLTKERCGILHASQGYGSEQLAFTTVNADGSAEEEELLSWYDSNRNGIMDEGDSFYGSEGIDMEQYRKARAEYTAMFAGKEPEWTDRRLESFATWQEAYIDFIRKIPITELTSAGAFRYSLIYVDANDVPELYIDTGFPLGGEIIVSFYDGKIGCVNRGRGGLKYIQRGGLLYSDWGAMGFYPFNIYRLEKGVFAEIGTGWYRDYVDEQNQVGFDYFWEDSAVTEAEYEAAIDALIDRTKCVEPALVYVEEEMLEILME